MSEPSFRVTDPVTLRALAHPFRQRLIWELSVRRSARAADLAEITGQPANSVSFHLRSLAKANLVVEAPELARDHRDRVWKLAHPEGLYWSPNPQNPNSDPLITDTLTWVHDLLTETLPDDVRATRGRYTGAALLTKDESTQLFRELTETLERWRVHGMDAADADPHNPDRVFHLTAAFMGNRAMDATPATGDPSGQNVQRAETSSGIRDVPTSVQES
jgi:DNA-binding transcriptional ArsR family regulator